MKITQIEGSLQYGRLFTGPWISFIYISLVLMLILPMITILMLIITFAIGMQWSSMMIGSLIGSNIFVGIIIAILICVLVRNKKLRKEVDLWLQNAVQVKAYSKLIDSVQLGIQPKQAKIQVEFIINGQKLRRISAGKMFGSKHEGYHKIWVYYANRKIDIMYSEKFDQVLILKDK